MKRLSNGLLKTFVAIRESEQAQGFVEYIMIVGLVGLGLVAALVAFRGQISTALNTIGTRSIAYAACGRFLSATRIFHGLSAAALVC